MATSNTQPLNHSVCVYFLQLSESVGVLIVLADLLREIQVSSVSFSLFLEGFLHSGANSRGPSCKLTSKVSETEAKQLGLYSLQDGAVRLGSLVGQNQPVKARFAACMATASVFG